MNMNSDNVQMTRPQCRNVKVETIERKAVVGATIQKNDFIFDYTKAETCNSNESSRWWLFSTEYHSQLSRFIMKNTVSLWAEFFP